MRDGNDLRRRRSAHLKDIVHAGEPHRDGPVDLRNDEVRISHERIRSAGRSRRDDARLRNGDALDDGCINVRRDALVDVHREVRNVIIRILHVALVDGIAHIFLRLVGKAMLYEPCPDQCPVDLVADRRPRQQRQVLRMAGSCQGERHRFRVAHRREPADPDGHAGFDQLRRLFGGHDFVFQ